MVLKKKKKQHLGKPVTQIYSNHDTGRPTTLFDSRLWFSRPLITRFSWKQLGMSQSLEEQWVTDCIGPGIVLPVLPLLEAGGELLVGSPHLTELFSSFFAALVLVRMVLSCQFSVGCTDFFCTGLRRETQSPEMLVLIGHLVCFLLPARPLSEREMAFFVTSVSAICHEVRVDIEGRCLRTKKQTWFEIRLEAMGIIGL